MTSSPSAKRSVGMADDEEEKPVPRPVIVKTEAFSPSISKLVMSDNTTLYGCTWPGCQVVAPKPGSIGAHYKAHSGKAAQRRRGERRPRTANTSHLQEQLLALMDQVHNLIDEVDSYEAEWEAIRHKAAQYDALKSLINEA